MMIFVVGGYVGCQGGVGWGRMVGGYDVVLAGLYIVDNFVLCFGTLLYSAYV
jgi:hypothetical protein